MFGEGLEEPSNRGLAGNCRILGVPAGLGDVGASIPVGAAAEREGDIARVAIRSDDVVVLNFILTRGRIRYTFFKDYREMCDCGRMLALTGTRQRV